MSSIPKMCLLAQRCCRQMWRHVCITGGENFFHFLTFFRERLGLTIPLLGIRGLRLTAPRNSWVGFWGYVSAFLIASIYQYSKKIILLS
jgi:hypothetical protein